MSIISSFGSSFQATAPGPSPSQQGNYGAVGLLASTGPGGFALQNATPTILSWTAPNDGQLHRITICGSVQVTSAETGGAIGLTTINPGNGAVNTLSAGTLAALGWYPLTATTVIVRAGQTINLVQSSALTVGGAFVYAEIWGS